jgi:hypothetical protein
MLEKVRVSLLQFLQSHDGMGTFNKQVNSQKILINRGMGHHRWHSHQTSDSSAIPECRFFFFFFFYSINVR